MKDPNTLFAALFEPKRIALIGASADETKTTSRPQRFLRKHGFKGEILPVNPSRTEILGDKAYKDVNAISGDIDHAYILLNGKGAVEALAACGKRGVKVASILAGGFADAGAAGASLQDDLARIVRETGIRLVGPNSIGTVSTDPPMALTANAAFAVDKLRTGTWGLVSQSGSLIGALLTLAVFQTLTVNGAQYALIIMGALLLVNVLTAPEGLVLQLFQMIFKTRRRKG